MSDFPSVAPLKPWAIERMEKLGWPPKARVTRCGRWTWRVEFEFFPDGMNESAVVLGAKRAERRARRMLAAYIAKCERERDWALAAKTIEAAQD